jgi:hypothetical protein
MNNNMGTTDRKVRVFLVAPVLVVLGVVLGPAAVVSWLLYGLAAVMLLTSSVSFCPLYALFRVSTRSQGSGAGTPVTSGR